MTVLSQDTAAYQQLGLSFEANQGQADPSVDFVAHGQGYTLWLSKGEALLKTSQRASARLAGARASTDDSASVVRMRLLGAAAQPEAMGQDALDGRANYLLGTDPSQWHTDIPTYARVRYRSVYPGIDLVYHASHQQLEHDFVVAPGADLSQIQLSFSDAEQVQLDTAGELVVQVPGGQLRQAAPLMYQDEPDGRHTLAGGYVLGAGGEVGFAVGAHDTSRPLVVDPVLTYSTFLGGSGSDQGVAIASDAAGDAYVMGTTLSTDFPITSDAPQPVLRAGASASDAFVAKLNPAGTALVYSTFLGSNNTNGLGYDSTRAAGVAVDAAGDAYLTGSTQAWDFPTTPGAFLQRIDGTPGSTHAFISKLNPAGSALLYSTYLGGAVNDAASSIAIDGSGNAYVTGTTESSNFPATESTLHFSGADAAFVTKLNPTGTALSYSVLLNGSSGGDMSQGNALTVDAAGEAYVAGVTNSTDFPTTPGAMRRSAVAQDGTYPSKLNAYVSKLTSAGTALMYSTYLGINGAGHGIALDTAGDAYVTGGTRPADFPATPGAFQQTYSGPSDAFVSKLTPSGGALVYATLLGGSGDDAGFGIAVDAAGNAYLTGSTSSTDFPTMPGAIQHSLASSTTHAFVTELNAAGAGLISSTYLGGNGADQGAGLALDPSGRLYVVGSTTSADFPITPDAFQHASPGGGGDAFVARFVLQVTPPSCQLQAVGINADAQTYIQILTQDAGSGLATVQVTESTNAEVDVPAFTPGIHTPVVVTATKHDQASGASVALRVTNQDGQSTDCDPGIVTVGSQPGESLVQVLHHLARSESHVRIVDGTPGVTSVRIIVNGHPFEAARLHPAEMRTLDVSSAMRAGSLNTLKAVARGPKGSSVTVIVAD